MADLREYFSEEEDFSEGESDGDFSFSALDISEEEPYSTEEEYGSDVEEPSPQVEIPIITPARVVSAGQPTPLPPIVSTAGSSEDQDIRDVRLALARLFVSRVAGITAEEATTIASVVTNKLLYGVVYPDTVTQNTEEKIGQLRNSAQ